MNTKMKINLAKTIFKAVASFEHTVDDATWEKDEFGYRVVDLGDVAFDLLGVPEDFRSELTDQIAKAADASDEALDRKIEYVLKYMRLEKKENPKLFKNV